MASVAAPSTYPARQRDAALSSAGFLVTCTVWCLVYAVVFLNAADFRGDTGETFSVHWQIKMRLMICAVCGMVGILLIHRSYREFLTFPGLMMTVLIAWIGMTTPLSIDRSYSVAAYVSLGAVVTLIPAAMRILGGYRFLLAVACGLMTFEVGSWIAYIVFPEVGVFNEQISQSEAVNRMGGLGHPNELGYYSAYTVILFSALAYSRRLSMWLAGPAILIGFATLVTCFSRTSFVVTFVALLVVYRKELFTERFVMWVLLLAILVCPLVFYVYGSGDLDWLVADALQKVSKSGSADELTTATGRTEIWRYGIQMIGEQPLYGYGYGTGRFVMEEYSYHCHNIVLNMSMYSGVIGGLILIAMILYFLYVMYHDPRYEIDGLIAIILVGGLIEGMLVSPVPAASMLVWTGGLFWRQMDMGIEN